MSSSNDQTISSSNPLRPDLETVHNIIKHVNDTDVKTHLFSRIRYIVIPILNTETNETTQVEYKLDTLAEVLLQSSQKDFPEAIQEDAKKLLDLYTSTDPRHYIVQKNRKALMQRVDLLHLPGQLKEVHRLLNQKNPTITTKNGYLHITDDASPDLDKDGGAIPKDTYRLDKLAKVLSDSGNKLDVDSLENYSRFEFDQDVKKLLKMYGPKPTFSVFGTNTYRKSLQQRIKYLDAATSPTARKSSTMFSFTFRPKMPVTIPSKTALDYQRLSPAQAREHVETQKQLSAQQLTSEKAGNFDPFYKIIHAERYNVSTKSLAKELKIAIVSLKDNRDQTAMQIMGHNVDLNTVIPKLITAINEIPEGCEDRRAIHLMCYEMLHRLEYALSNIHDTENPLIQQIQAKCLELEQQLLDTIPTEDWIIIASDFQDLAIQEEKLTSSNIEEASLAEDYIPIIQRRITTRAINADIVISIHDKERVMQEKFTKVQETYRRKDINKMISDHIEKIEQTELTTVKEIIDTYKTLIDTKKVLERTEEIARSPQLQKIELLLTNIINLITTTSDQDLARTIEGTYDQWYFIEEQIAYLASAEDPVSIKREIVRSILGDMVLNANESQLEILFEKIMRAHKLKTQVPNIKKPDPIPLHIPTTECSTTVITEFLDSIVDNPQLNIKREPRTIEAVEYQLTDITSLGSHTAVFCETEGRCDKGLSSMEDKHLLTSFDITVKGKTYPVRLAGAFDGHGGDLAARYAQHFYPAMLRKRLEQCNRNLTTEEITEALTLTTVDLHKGWCEYCKQKITSLEQELASTEDQKVKDLIYPKKQMLLAGTTSCILAQIGDDWYTANVGDSRIILVRLDAEVRLVTAVATPKNQQKEIEKRGGVLDPNEKRFSAPGKGRSCSSGRTIGDCFMEVESDYDSPWVIKDLGVNPRSTVQVIPKEEVPEGSYFELETDFLAEDYEDIGKVSSSKQVGDFIKTNAPRSSLYSGIDDVAKSITIRGIQAGSQDNGTVGIIKVHYATTT